MPEFKPIVVKNSARTAAGVFVSFSIAFLLGEALGYFEWHWIVPIGDQLLSIADVAIILVACFLGAFVARKNFLSAFLPIYLALYLYGVQTMQRILENTPNPPTYVELLLDTTYGGVINIAVIIVFGLIGERFGRWSFDATDT